MTVSAIKPASSTRARRPSRRSATLKWLRNTHSWLGLWGAALGLLFGITGIVMDHRSIMKIPLPHPQESTVQLPLPEQAPVNADAMARWLQATLALEHKATRVKTEAVRAVAWGDKKVMQPEHWNAMFSTPRVNVQGDYWVGNNFVTVKRSDNGLLAVLLNLHKGVGVGPGWILLADSVAGSLIMLSLTGIAMWVLTNRRRTIGLVVGGASVAAALGLALIAM
ncbi:MAG: PepSY-associated TM helix domain-containing protein [bacterium]|nr:PepSY-associated TM helix domain-containing protein [bacterium]